METLNAKVQDTLFRNEENGYTVLRVSVGSARHTVVGAFPPLSEGETVAFSGDWTEHPVYGRQFSAKALSVETPKTTDAIERYLASGLIRGVREATARAIVAAFGEETLSVLDEHPERLAEVRGISPKRAQMIAESYFEQMGVRRVLLFLQGLDIPTTLALKISRFYGEATQETLRANPYKLVEDIEGVGFQTADRIALSMGFSRTSGFRVRSALLYVLMDAAMSAGHTYLPLEDLYRHAAELLRVEEDIVRLEARAAMLDRKLAGMMLPDGGKAIFLPQYLYAEREIAERVKRLMAARGDSASRGASASRDGASASRDGGASAHIAAIEMSSGITFSPNQRAAITRAAAEGVFVVTGGPGTGKTTLINCILRLVSGEGDIVLCAPTGRAAKRMSEATGREAKTIHRLLEYGGDDNTFLRDEDDPLDAACVIVDEMSMVDVMLMRALLRAVPVGARLILVGDADQLPSVGAGNVLRDILDSGVVPSARLTEIFRQEDDRSLIVENAHRINQGELPILNARGSDFFFERRALQTDAADAVTALLTERLPRFLGYPDAERLTLSMRDIQALSPAKKGDCGVWALNKRLQEALNPPARGKRELRYGDKLFREGDKVIQTKNDYQLPFIRRLSGGAEEEGSGVFNGDVGFVLEADDDACQLVVLFDDEREVAYGKQQLEELELAYCLTVHKSQGSEFPVVVLPVVGGPPMLMARNLLYTALTRARRLVVLVGREEVVAQMVRNNYVTRRYTSLCQRLREAMGEDDA